MAFITKAWLTVTVLCPVCLMGASGDTSFDVFLRVCIRLWGFDLIIKEVKIWWITSCKDTNDLWSCAVAYILEKTFDKVNGSLWLQMFFLKTFHRLELILQEICCIDKVFWFLTQFSFSNRILSLNLVTFERSPTYWQCFEETKYLSYHFALPHNPEIDFFLGIMLKRF